MKKYTLLIKRITSVVLFFLLKIRTGGEKGKVCKIMLIILSFPYNRGRVYNENAQFIKVIAYVLDNIICKESVLWINQLN